MFRLCDVFKILILLVLFTACSTTIQRDPAHGSVPVLIAPVAELSSTEVVNGSVFLVTVQIPSNFVEPSITGSFDGIDLPFFSVKPEEYSAIVGVPVNYQAGPAAVKIQVSSGINSQTMVLPFNVIKGNYQSEVLLVPPRMAKPSKKDLIRIKREGLEVKSIYRQITLKKYWESMFRLPVESPLTSVFGTSRVFNGEIQSIHQGIDLKAAVGTPVYAAAGGVVVLAKDLFFSGNTVLLDHGYGVFTIYAHLSKIDVNKGQQIKSGEVLGLAGMTGRVSGPHLHWGTVVHSVKVNPMDLMKVMQ